MKGQLTYDKVSKSWKYTEPNNITDDVCQSFYKIQSRNGYYLCWVGGERRQFDSLSECLLWVEKTANIK